ncbi:MAG TPA: LLM class F420-dependent oxidoreductase [Candidatus Binataceae bacterium]|nr:LLM class F420-dependent oxidoreductase [Candidatus Binataceae bacterium]
MPHFAVSMFPADYAIQPIELAQASEERGFESLWFPEHTHIPASRKTPWPAGGELPPEYWHSHDPFVALGACAAATKKIKLATGVCLVIERDPITLAKEVASLDMISGGRVLLGIGAGWNVEEMANHGANAKRKWKTVREKILAMKEIWTREAAEFHGEIVNFDPIWSYPKPVQTGGPPIIMGSQSKKVFERVAEYCDGWMPINNPRYDFVRALTAMREELGKRGRKPDSISLSIFGVGPSEDDTRKFIGLGFERIVFALPPAPRDKVLPLLDKYATLAQKIGRG